MHSIKSKGLQALLAATVTALVVMPIAIAGATSPAATGSKVSPAKQIKALKAQTAKLADAAAALVKQVATLEAKTVALEGKKGPTSLPPSGPAGGDLTGNFPKPLLAPNSVGSPQITDNTVQSADITDAGVRSIDIGDQSIGGVDLAPQSVGGLALRGVESVVGTGVVVAEGEEAVRATVTCPGGSRLLSGGYEWASVTGKGARVVSTSPAFPGGGDPAFTWQVVGIVENNGDDNMIFAEALCLKQ